MLAYYLGPPIIDDAMIHNTLITLLVPFLMVGTTPIAVVTGPIIQIPDNPKSEHQNVQIYNWF